MSIIGLRVLTLCADVDMECKVLGTEDEGFMPNFSFHISLNTLQHTEVKMLTKSFGLLYDDHSLIDSHVYMKSRVPCFSIYCEEKVLSESSIKLCIQT